MQMQKSKIWFAVIITAIVVGGAVYYFMETKNSEMTSPKKENISLAQNSKRICFNG